MTIKSYNYLSATLAFIIWGAWAYYTNIDSPNKFLSAISQGVASFIITLIMIKIIEYFYQLLPKNKLYFILPAIITVTITSSFVILIHLLIDTKNILLTVIPTIIVALIFSIYTTVTISNQTIKKEN